MRFVDGTRFGYIGRGNELVRIAVHRTVPYASPIASATACPTILPTRHVTIESRFDKTAKNGLTGCGQLRTFTGPNKTDISNFLLARTGMQFHVCVGCPRCEGVRNLLSLKTEAFLLETADHTGQIPIKSCKQSDLTMW